MPSSVPIPGGIPWTPIPPDFHICDQTYGQNLRLSDCFAAIESLPTGEGIMLYSVNGADSEPWNFPSYKTYGSCTVSIEMAGPVEGSLYRIAPSTIRGLAGWVWEQCIIGKGIGGFITYGMSSFIDPIVGSTVSRFPEMDLPNNAQFITVSLTGPLKRLSSPGNTDPAIPEVVSQKLEDAAGQSPRGSSQWQKFDTTSQVWKLTSQSMQRGSGIPWWSKTISSNPDEMTYECDATLGSPAEADCAQIEWNQLGPWSISPPSDMVSVGPGKVQFLHSNSCVLAISATLTTILTWAQIRAAVTALMSTCIQTPLQTSKGGRAYYSPPVTFPAIIPRDLGRSRLSLDRRQATPSALNALPLHANITMFAQKERWVGEREEAGSCTWEAIVRGRDVDGC
ncbi:hypothetical protein MMC14_006661 [Varicellaria rhodocarpa]|nr:hypothetical protein [Varicellaria rhodocarpa]